MSSNKFSPRTVLGKGGKISIKGKVWLWPGGGGWHFVYAGKEDSERLRYGSNSSKIPSLTIYRKRTKLIENNKEGRNKENGKRKVVRKGFIPVRAKLGDTTWDTSLFPHKDEPYLLSIKASVRKAEGVFAGDIVSVSCTLR